MASETEISWTDSTFSPWIGCTKVSPGCDNCYAAVSTPSRVHGIIWGAGEPRHRTGVSNWNLPKRWNAQPWHECTACGLRGMGTAHEYTRLCTGCSEDTLKPARRRVFCSSLADVFDNEVDPQWRADLFKLIRATPHLDWLLLTKRIGNVARMVTDAHMAIGSPTGDSWDTLPPNVRLGISVCNQPEADRDIKKLVELGCPNFLSMEPLLGPVNIEPYLEPCRFVLDGEHVGTTPAVDWVIVGGESGKDARPMNPDWVRSLREQCEAAGVPLHFKQWGEWADSTGRVGVDHSIAVWPDGGTSVNVGKKAAGRELDGRTHNDFPRVTP